MKRHIGLLPVAALAVVGFAAISVFFLTSAGCSSAAAPSRKTIVVTTSVLGSVVKDLAGDRAAVVVLMPNGQDPHEWEPSAKDIETVMRADLVVQNGLGLEGGMEKTLQQAKNAGVGFFTAADHVTVRRVRQGEGTSAEAPDQGTGAQDPHLWMDPIAMKAVASALASRVQSDLGIDLTDRAADLGHRLDALAAELSEEVGSLPASDRSLVTGHESLGYFAERFGFQLVGAIVPSVSSQAEASASELAALKAQMQERHVKAIFTELGTPKVVAEAISKETGARVIPLATHTLPADGSYFTFMRDLTRTIVEGLK